MSPPLPMWKSAAMVSRWANGGLVDAISTTVTPSDHTSDFVLLPWPRITSGAIQYGEPTTDDAPDWVLPNRSAIDLLPAS